MNLVLEELGRTYSSLKQKITIGDRDIIVKHVRPHIYKHLAPAGSITVEIEDSSNVTIAESAAVTITDISAVNYFHGEVRFDVSARLLKNTDYYIVINSSGYTYSDAAFVGWCTDYDLQKVERDYTPANSLYTPFLLELWEVKKFEKGKIS